MRPGIIIDPNHCAPVKYGHGGRAINGTRNGNGSGQWRGGGGGSRNPVGGGVVGPVIGTANREQGHQTKADANEKDSKTIHDYLIQVD